MRSVWIVPLAALALATPALAKNNEQLGAPPPVYQAVVDCRNIGDAVKRLDCFDRTVRLMAEAGEAKDLVVLDREAVRETRRGLFGFTLPTIKLFGGGRDNDEKEEITEIESTITALRTAADGKPIYTIADGAKWKQTEARDIFPKVGQAIRIRKAALGSYMANVEGRRAVRVMRLP